MSQILRQGEKMKFKEHRREPGVVTPIGVKLLARRLEMSEQEVREWLEDAGNIIEG